MAKSCNYMLSPKSSVKHRIAMKQYKLDKYMGATLPDKCAWLVYPTVQKTVVMMLGDKNWKYGLPHFVPVRSSLTLKEALKLSRQLYEAVKASKKCPVGEKKRMENELKDIFKKKVFKKN